MEPKISVAEIVLITPFLVIFELLSIIPLVGSIVSLMVGFLLWFYLKTKDVPSVGPTLVALVDVVPVVGAFLFLLTAFFIAVVIDRVPALRRATDKTKLK